MPASFNKAFGEGAIFTVSQPSFLPLNCMHFPCCLTPVRQDGISRFRKIKFQAVLSRHVRKTAAAYGKRAPGIANGLKVGRIDFANSAACDN